MKGWWLYFKQISCPSLMLNLWLLTYACTNISHVCSHLLRIFLVSASGEADKRCWQLSPHCGSWQWQTPFGWSCVLQESNNYCDIMLWPQILLGPCSNNIKPSCSPLSLDKKFKMGKHFCHPHLLVPTGKSCGILSSCYESILGNQCGIFF